MRKGCVYNILSLLLGLLLVLAVGEIVLRGAGYLRTRQARQARTRRDGAATTILCLGDSFTMGFGAPAGRSYPAQLEELLAPHGDYAVVNEGVDDQNTAQILEKVDEQAKKHMPEVVLILAGGPNAWNRYGAPAAGVTGEDEGKSWGERMAGWSRLYRFAELVADQVSARRAEARGEVKVRDTNTYLRLLSAYDAAAAPRDKAKAAYEVGAFLYARERNREAGEDWFRRGMMMSKGFVPNYIGVARVEREEGDVDEEFEVLHDGLAMCGEDARLLCEIAQLSMVREAYTNAAAFALRAVEADPESARAYETLQRVIDAHPRVVNQVTSHAAYAHITDGTPSRHHNEFPELEKTFAFDTDASQTFAWIQHDLSRIAETCRESGAAVYLLTYPLHYAESNWRRGDELANRVIRATAETDAIGLCDLAATFPDGGEEMRALFEPENVGNHPNERGYGVMALQVAQYLGDGGHVPGKLEDKRTNRSSDAEESTTDSAGVRILKGDMSMKLGKATDAIREYSGAIELSPSDATAYARRARMWSAMGNEMMAEADSRKARELSEEAAEEERQ